MTFQEISVIGILLQIFQCSFHVGVPPNTEVKLMLLRGVPGIHEIDREDL